MQDFDKYMKGDVTGWTSYLALQRVLMRWHAISGNEYAEWLYTSLMTDPALMEDWALSLKEAIEERGEHNQEQAFDTEFPTSYKKPTKEEMDIAREKSKSS